MWTNFISLLALASSFAPAVSPAAVPTNSLTQKRADAETLKLHRPGFPVPNPTKSYWQEPPNRIANLRSTPDLPTAETFDYIIIGSGISGATTAFKLLSRDRTLKLLMLEARTAASGASGRNGGHVRPSFWTNIKKLSDAYGEDDGLRICNMEQDCVNDVADFVRSHNVSSDFTDVETADVYWTKDAFDQAVKQVQYQHSIEARRPNDVPKNKHTVYAGQEARDYWQLPQILGAVTWKAHTQNPYDTVCAILEQGLQRGLNLQTNTMALGLDKIPTSDMSAEGAKWQVKTDRGTVKGKQVVLATNGFTNAIHPGFAATDYILPGRSQVTVVHPEAYTSDNVVFQRSMGYDDFPCGENYIAPRPPGSKGEGDIIYGGFKELSPTGESNITDDSVINEDIAAALQRIGRVAYGYENWGEETAALGNWTGITCYTPDTFPLVGNVPGDDGLWAIVCMNGHGMGWAYRSAEALVEMMMEGKAPDWFPSQFMAQRAWEVKRNSSSHEM